MLKIDSSLADRSTKLQKKSVKILRDIPDIVIHLLN